MDDEQHQRQATGRAVVLTTEADFHRFLIDVLSRVGQFADFGAQDAQRPAILEDIALLRLYVQGQGEDGTP